ncbi:formate dehydrogenase iron-sulfur subunit [Saccharopolyspora kobensis]|uniref:Formate dehydrogenase iron-sulfur subunit n=1 Tax=Saccharopolyspora kobensis TaxID=146035 RepID=A0A1H5V575_9PSEU|nr:NAD(P)H-dependent oxidoreductase subunit E [Saccharopolyspora kobensis]SEF82572.1 formate dehydrogenase iron-sulfur subunit [Saccharopolyspora kobensis]SFC65031.1 formate dehydrogenase iron-sulfur subunit [Saccharopolyspora kobensis]
MGRDAFVEWERRFGSDETAVLQRLHDTTVRHGRVDRRDLHAIAEEFRLPVAAVAGAAGFYADFGGEHGTRHVRICAGTSCFVSAGDHTAPLAEAALGVAPGRTSADGSVSLAEVHCLGYCYASPTALDGHTPITGPDLGARLLDTEHPAAAAPAIPYRVAGREAVVLAGLVGAERSWQVWPHVVTAVPPGAVRAEVALAGLRGRGGAEFPVAEKWRSAARGPAPRFVVANGDEGDPGSFCDRLLMESDPDRVLEGLALAAFATGASRGAVFVRSEYPVAVARMRAAVDAARAAGHLGRGVHGSSFDFDVEVVEGAGSYVAGEETALLHALQGLRGGVRPRPPYPTESGLAERPTAVNNVETLAAVPWVLRHGGGNYARLGNRTETGTKLVCLSQRFRHPGVYEVEFGVPLRHIVENLGGGLKPGFRLRALQIGGPLGGFVSPDDLDVPLLAGALTEAGVALGHGSLVAIDDQIAARELLQHVWRFAAAESCGACTPCRVGTRRGQELAAHFPAGSEQILSQHEKLLEVMSVGSLCAFGRGVPAAVRSLLRVYRDELTSGDS